MAGVKISGLPAIVAPLLTDIMPEVQPAVGGVTYKATLNQVLTLFQANIQITEAQVTNLVTDLASKVNRSGDTMTGYLILNADPIVPLGAATKQYVDNIAQGLNILPACYAATTVVLAATYSNGVAGVGATLTNSAGLLAFSIDSVSPPLGSRILVKDQSTTFQNGIYILTTVGDAVTPWVLTRATDYDSPSEINPGDYVLINYGATNSATAWVETNIVNTVGVDAILWSQFGAAFPLAISHGGTGATTAAGARTNLGAAANNANSDITSMTGLTGVLQAPSAITSSTGLNLVQFQYVPSAVNSIILSNNILTDSPFIETIGADPEIALEFHMKGGQISLLDSTNTFGAHIFFFNAAHDHSISIGVAPGMTSDVDYLWPQVDGSADFIMKTNGAGVLSFANGSQIAGTATNDNATTGNIGEKIQSIIPSASAISMTTNTSMNITTISLTPGDWDLYGNITLVSASVGATSFLGWINLAPSTIPDQPSYNGIVTSSILAGTGLEVPFASVQLSVTTTVYLSAKAIFSGTASVCGGIYARRAR